MERPQLPGSTDPGAGRFLVGANLPWLRYGGDFGANAWRPDGGVARPDARARLRDALGRLADAGVDTVRWFLLCDGRAGIRDGRASGPELDDHVLVDLDAALDEAERSGVRLLLVLLDYLWFAPARTVNGVRLGGRRDLAGGPVVIDRLLGPLLERAGAHPSVAGWDIINEPEWATRGAGGRSRADDVSAGAMRSFIGAAVQAVHGLTRHPATVGLASQRGLPLVRGLGLDVYQIHWYDHLDRVSPLDRPVEALGLDRPVVLGEYPTRGSARTAAAILEAARTHGYAGAFAWSVLSEDEASDRVSLEAAVAGWTSAGRRAAPGTPPAGSRGLRVSPEG